MLITYLIWDNTLNGFAPTLSNLFINAIQGTLYRFICLFTVNVWLCTPPTQHNTRTAPSNTLSALSTSTVKSTWPKNIYKLLRWHLTYFGPFLSRKTTVVISFLLSSTLNLFWKLVYSQSNEFFLFGVDPFFKSGQTQIGWSCLLWKCIYPKAQHSG